MPEIEAEGAAHDAGMEVAYRPEIPGIVRRVCEILGEHGNRSLGRPAQAIQLIALLSGAGIGDGEQQRHG